MNQPALATLLKSYGKAKALLDGRCVHTHLSEHGLDRTALLGNFLIEMYGLCGCIQDARSVFDHLLNPNLLSWNILVKAYGHNGHVSHACHVFHHMPYRDVVSWNAIISALSQNGHGKEALHIYNQMLLEGQLPDKVTFICVLDACAGLASLKEGQNIHVAILENDYDGDVVVGTALVNLYGKCKSLDTARHVFGRLHPDTVAWNAMIVAASQNDHGKHALDLFYRMEVQGIKPNKVTFICALGAFTNLATHEDGTKMHEEGAKIHAAIVNDGYEHDVGVATALVTMYSSCGNLSDAKHTFISMMHRNVVSWNAMIAAFSRNGKGRDALALFSQMLHEQGIMPDRISFVCSLDACASLALFEEGRKVHATIIDSGYEGDLEVGNKLFSMYARCGYLDDARITFDKLVQKDIVSWNTMIAAYAQNGCLECANGVFSRMPDRDIASWNTLIAAYSQNGLGREALSLFQKMYCDCLKPNEVTFLCALHACANLADLEAGEMIHAAVIGGGYDENHVMGNTLINMYGKCGSLDNAMGMFNKKAYKDVVSWNAMIGAVALNGHGKDAVKLFNQMQVEGKKPNATTFICVLFACNFTGCVDDSRHIFLSMNDFDITHTLDHNVCMIDLLGRAGHMDEAEGLINTMPFKNVNVAWFCLLGACNIHNDVERGIHTANYCFQMDPEYASPYVMLSNIYAGAGRWHEVG